MSDEQVAAIVGAIFLATVVIATAVLGGVALVFGGLSLVVLSGLATSWLKRSDPWGDDGEEDGDA